MRMNATTLICGKCTEMYDECATMCVLLNVHEWVEAKICDMCAADQITLCLNASFKCALLRMHISRECIDFSSNECICMMNVADGCMQGNAGFS